MTNYTRNVEQLGKNALLHWPDDIIAIADKTSVLPRLLKTQQGFKAILVAANNSPSSWKTVLAESRDLYGNLFLKHLMVLSDLGGEALNKLPPLRNYFPEGEMKFFWGFEEHVYKFQAIQNKISLTNTGLKVDAGNLICPKPVEDKIEDTCMLILFGSAAINDSLPTEVKTKCNVGEYLGNSDALDEYMKQRYLFVSKQVSGAQSNALGHATQAYVAEILANTLPPNWQINLDGTLPGISHSENGNETVFDVVVTSPTNKYFGVEVSFQVTTNSVIERKAREARNILHACRKAKHKVCYVIDGAGNINIRKNAVGIICESSDCTVTASKKEIEYLAEFMLTVENEN